MPELCQWEININYLAARLRQIYSKPAARFICMVKLHCHNLAVGLQQSSSKLAARLPLALPQGLFFGKGCDKSCCSTLDSFELLDVYGSVGVPGCSCILNHRSDERSVPLGLDLAWAS